MDHRRHRRRSGQSNRIEKQSPGRKGGGGGGGGEQDGTDATPADTASTSATPTKPMDRQDDDDKSGDDNDANNTAEEKQQQPPEGFDITNLGLFLFPNLPRGRLPRFPWFGGSCPIASGGRGRGNSPGRGKPTDDFTSPSMRKGVVVVVGDEEEARSSSGDDGYEGESDDDDGVVGQRWGEEEDEDDENDNGGNEYEGDGTSSAIVETKSVTRGRVQGCWPRGSLFHKARSRGRKEVGISDGDGGGVFVGQARRSKDEEKSGTLSSSNVEMGRALTEDDKRLAGRVQGYWIGAAASR